MAGNLDTAVEGRGAGGGLLAPEQRRRGLGWRRLQLIAGLGVLGALVLSMRVVFSPEPLLLAMAPSAIGLLVMLRWPRVGAICLGVSSLALLLFSAPYLADALTHPESVGDFIPLSILTVSLLVGTVAAVPSFREGRDPAGGSALPVAIAVGAGAVLVAASVVGIVAVLRTESVPSQAGDIRVVTEGFVFHPPGISAVSGEVSVHVTNRDSTRHTFTIDRLGVDLNVPPDGMQRVTFAAGPGTYRFYCRPHSPGMEGELVVG
jgi:plastocyanin